MLGVVTEIETRRRGASCSELVPEMWAMFAIHVLMECANGSSDLEINARSTLFATSSLHGAGMQVSVWGPGSCGLPCRRNRICLLPIPFPGRLTAEFSDDAAGRMDQSGTAFPASAAFLELPAFGVFWATGFALLAVAAVELQRHAISPWKLGKITAPWHAIARWKRINRLSY